MDNPLRPAVTLWLAKIKLAWDKKQERFGRDADEGMKFYTGPYGFLYDGKQTGTGKHFYVNDPEGTAIRPPKPTFAMTVNKVAELVQIFAPNLYHQNPQRQVNPRRQVGLTTDIFPLVAQAFPELAGGLMQLQQMSVQLGAQDSIRATLLQEYTNATPDLLGLKTQARMAIDEALIKGMGMLMPRAYTPENSQHKVVGSFWHSVDDLVIDPDAKSLDTAKWVAIRRVRPKWEVVSEFKLEQEEKNGHVKGSIESVNMQATVGATGFDGQVNRATGKTADLIVYWEVYSKCGIGERLQGGDTQQMRDIAADLTGDFVYLCVSPDLPYPLNCPPSALDVAVSDQARAQIQYRFQWPTPFHADGLWPFCPFTFHWVPNDPWPASHLSFAMGELKFLNWFYSHLAGKVLVTSRDLLVVDKGASDKLKESLANGGDLTLIELEKAMGKPIDEVIKFLQHPPMNKDIFSVAEAIEHLFEQRTGLTELKYGLSSRQYRSAAEAEIKKEQSDVRPEEMQNEVEDAMSMLGRMEALCCRWHLAGMDVQPIIGGPAALLWQQFVVPTDPRAVLYDLSYRVEAGSVRKPNRSRDAENMVTAMQQLMPFFQQLAMMGVTGPYNTLVAAYAKTLDMDPALVMLPTPPPQPAQPALPAGQAA